LQKSEIPEQRVLLHRLGRIPYAEAWKFQEYLFDNLIREKVERRNLNTGFSDPVHHLILCSHPPVYTLGKSANPANLLLHEDLIKSQGAEIFKTNRGGDITFHGPGQLVVYPIFDLDFFFTDIHRYLRTLEESVILTLTSYGINADRYPGYTGVWIQPENEQKARKICAMGVRCSRWVTMHGLAFNLNTDLQWFNHIVPCGISDKKVSSLHLETGKTIDEEETADLLVKNMAVLFNFILKKA
jgi:lipoyl(octanoyl) transferase